MNDPTYHQQGFPTTAFTLQSASPAINKGADLVALGYVSDMGSHDFFGNTIPKGHYDIGVYEFGEWQPTQVYLATVFK
ncbi:MAG: choice-of-anchor Q domain-containing protein [Anaerolineales bacterium]